MQRYIIKLSYDGTRYHGWQIQPNGISVQEVLENALTTIMRTNISITGAGRTDAGVHARMMVAHFDLGNSIDEHDLVYKLNRFLPNDISVSAVEQVDDDFHARFSAKSRTYHYYLHTEKDAFQRHYSCELRYELDFEKMNDATKLLLGQKDFKCFCKTGADSKTTICNVIEAAWHQLPADECTLASRWFFRITADRFLRNMVRAVVGTLIEVGRGRITLAEFKQILDSGSRCDAGESMPANALFLWDIKY